MKYGDVLRMSDAYIKAVPTCYKDKRIMFVYQSRDHITAILIRKDPREKRWDLPGELAHYSGTDVWVVADE